MPSEEGRCSDTNLENKGVTCTNTPSTSHAAPCTADAPRITNVVATVDLGCRLDLAVLHHKSINSEYSKDRHNKAFPCVTIAMKEPKATVQVFASGKMNCTGAKSEGDAKLAAKKMHVLVKRMGFQVTKKLQAFTITNITASCKLKFHIYLQGVAKEHPMFATYDPELSSSLTFRLNSPKVTVMVQHNGNLNFAGAKKTEDIETAFSRILPLLEAHKLPVPLPDQPAK